MIETCHISGLLIVTPKKFEDSRGYFSETFNEKRLKEFGFEGSFVQDNQSLSVASGVVRGLHFQTPPFAQDKLIRVLRGSIYDVAVDLRKSSPTYGQHFGIELSASNWKQLLVPIGFAHGFCTLEAHTEVAYKVTNYYAPTHESGILYNDPDLNVDWPISKASIISEKDQVLPNFKDFVSPFK
ncbi:MAG: dTDP-4-dehydrorhamnose 3,5-epimerase [Lentilitoribacter sp.]